MKRLILPLLVSLDLPAGYTVIYQTRDAKDHLALDHIYASFYLSYRY
jgi:hypothetical protein